MTVIHVVIFAACLVAALEISRSYNALIHLRWKTRIAAKVFFVSLAATQLGLAFDGGDGTFFDISYTLQAVALVAFLILLFLDLNKGLARLKWAFQAIQTRFGADGDTMIATVIAALQGQSRDDRTKL